MKNLFDLLTFEWFLPKAFIGLGIGFMLRVIEHYAYYKRKGTVEKLFSLVDYGARSINLHWNSACLYRSGYPHIEGPE